MIYKYLTYFSILLLGISSASNENDVNDLPKSCAEALAMGGADDVYMLHTPDSSVGNFWAYCMDDEDGNDAWTVIQRRQDGSQNFFRSWQDYQLGFGNVLGEYFIGLEKIHALTNREPQELWILLKDSRGRERSAKYNRFAIANEDTKYALSVLGNYSGDAGDSFSFQAGRPFSTGDADNGVDGFPNCALTFKSGWWFRNCYESNLNGIYVSNIKRETINWKGFGFDLSYTHMAIRPVTNHDKKAALELATAASS